MTWQEAVARLAGERTVGETCAGLLKRHGDEAQVARGALAYAEAKAEFDGVIAGLLVALARKAGPEGLPDLEDRLAGAFAASDGFRGQVQALLPARAGERDVLAGIAAVGGSLATLIGAVAAIWNKAAEADRLTAKTIEAQLEAARWPGFAAVAPA